MKLRRIANFDSVAESIEASEEVKKRFYIVHANDVGAMIRISPSTWKIAAGTVVTGVRHYAARFNGVKDGLYTNKYGYVAPGTPVLYFEGKFYVGNDTTMCLEY